MSIVDEVLINDIVQTEVDSETHATTVSTQINLPDGGLGFLIIGRIVQDRKTVWKPLKEVIKRFLIEYDEAYEVSLAPKEDSLLAE